MSSVQEKFINKLYYIGKEIKALLMSEEKIFSENLALTTFLTKIIF